MVMPHQGVLPLTLLYRYLETATGDALQPQKGRMKSCEGVTATGAVYKACEQTGETSHTARNLELTAQLTITDSFFFFLQEARYCIIVSWMMRVKSMRFHAI